MNIDAAADRRFCNEMLPKVSRTFAICIRLLPRQLEHPVLVAYLLCRIADTIEDTTSLSGSQKNRLLEDFRRCLEHDREDASTLRTAFDEYRDDDERLARESDVVLREFRRLPLPLQEKIKPWVMEMCAGMAQFIDIAGSGSKGYVTSLNTVDDLDRYCYYVAGTVGNMLTDIFSQVKPQIDEVDYARMKTLATSFGLGLQLTNIIKDVADDRKRGHNYLPRTLCRGAGIEPEDVQDGRYPHESRQVVDALVRKAQGHLCDALDYTTCVPRRQHGIRSFCLTSLFFAVKTLRLTEMDDTVLSPSKKLKISRAAVHRTILTTQLIASHDGLVEAYFRRLAGPTWWSQYLANRF